MATYFFRICLLFSLFLYAGCLGGPKVDPPAILDDRTAGPDIAGAGGNAGATNDSMDSGVETLSNETIVDTEEKSEDGGATQQSDSGLTDSDDDAGSTHES